MYRFFVPLACALLLSAGCQVAKAPTQMLMLDYHFTSTDGKADPDGAATTDVDITAPSITFETFPYVPEANLAISYLRRNHELALGAGDVEADILRLQLRWHYELAKALTWYIGPGIGYAISVDGPVGTSFDSSLYWDAEAGVRFFIDESYGVQGDVNYGVLMGDGSGFTSDTDFRGITAFVGAFLNL